MADQLSMSTVRHSVYSKVHTVRREDNDSLAGLHLVHRNLVFIRVRTVQPLFGGKLTSFWIRLVDLRVVVEATYQSAITQGLW